jgi:Ca2+-transporting ATPase
LAHPHANVPLEITDFLKRGDHLEAQDFDTFVQVYQKQMAAHDRKLPSDICHVVISTIFRYTREKAGVPLMRKPQPQAIAALRMLLTLLKQDSHLRQAMQFRTVEDLRRDLRLHRFVLYADSFRTRANDAEAQEAKVLACRLVWVLSSQFRAFSNWKDYVRTDAHEAVEQYLRQDGVSLPEMKSMMEQRRRSMAVVARSGSTPGSSEKFFSMQAAEVVAMMESNDVSGLSSKSVAERIEQHGRNRLPSADKRSLLKIIWRQVGDFMVLLLIAAAVVSAVMQDYKAAAVLALVVLVNTVIGSVQEYKAEKSLEALKQFSVPHAKVVRDGDTKDINAEELVPGDVLTLDEGDQVPADARILEVHGLEVDEAVLTGESMPVMKTADALAPTENRTMMPIADQTNMLFMSTMVTKGRCRAVVVATGISTEVGKISTQLTGKNKIVSDTQSPLQRKLARLGKYLVAGSVALCILLGGIGIAQGRNWLDMVLVSVSLAVSVIPEGLVVVATIALARSVRRMAAQRVIVRDLASVETLGSVTVVASDKTGTLTEGKMVAKRGWIAGSGFVDADNPKRQPFVGRVEVEYEGGQGKQKLHLQANSSSSSSDRNFLFFEVCALCNNASIHREDQHQSGSGSGSVSPQQGNAGDRVTSPGGLFARDGDIESTPILGRTNTGNTRERRFSIWRRRSRAAGTPRPEANWTVQGDPTEAALLITAIDAGLSKEALLSSENPITRSLIAEHPFDSDRKLMSVVYELSSKGRSNGRSSSSSTVRIMVKGALETVLPLCSRWYTMDSEEPVAFSQSGDGGRKVVEDHLSSIAQELAGDGLRVLCIAGREEVLHGATSEGKTVDWNDREIVERDLTLYGLIGLWDPPRNSALQAIKRCHNAGILVVMITGDAKRTAQAVGDKMGILDTFRSHQFRLPISEDAPLLHDEERTHDASQLFSQMSRVLSGADLESMSEQQLATIYPPCTVFARVSPMQKLLIVKALRRAGHIVAFCGDGTNDSLSMKAAHVAVGMGKNGTDLAKQASSIILLDDDFASLEMAITEGRRAFDNIQKFIIYLLSCNASEIVVMFFAVCLNLPVPFTAIYILFANLVVDVIPSLCLSLDSAEPDVMDRPPRPPQEAVIPLRYLPFLCLTSALMSLFTLLSFILSMNYGDYSLMHSRSFAFMMLCTLQNVHAFQCRSFELSMFHDKCITFTNNRLLWMGVLASQACLMLSIYVPFLESWLGLFALDWMDWMFISAAVVAQLLLTDLIKIGEKKYRDRKVEKVLERIDPHHEHEMAEAV